MNDYREVLANQIRVAMGEFNDDEKPVAVLVSEICRRLRVNGEFRVELIRVLAWCAEFVEAEAECLKESHTNFAGKWDDGIAHSNFECQKDMVSRINALLQKIND